MVKIGMMLADRYEIIEKIGTGGMSDVYKAKDHKLNRFVAIKVLKQEFSENTNFVSKFKVEAQAAAGLMHPNIVNVYDVEEQDGMHFIVMELVEGITLKKYIEKKVHLTTKEAISIAIQVSMGIEAAHNNHIIHRDIKPQNIMISKEGKVKVTDFGIAKAATSNTITSNVMGSVHYTSPEQARGGFSDEKSDVYSMGITLFEMLTGRVPFNGDTTVTIAIKHIQEEMPSPRKFVSDIPISVEQIVFKCTQKSPDRRYQNMEQLIADLKKSLIKPDEDFVKIQNVEDASKTKIVTDMDVKLQRRANFINTSGKEQYNRDAEYEEDDVRTDSYQSESRKHRNTVSEESKRKDDFINTRIDDRVKAKDYYEYSDEDDFGSTRQINSKNKKVQNKNKNQSSENKKDGKSQKMKINFQDKYDVEDEYDYNPKMEKITTILTIVAAVIVALILLFFAGKAVGIFENIGIDHKGTGQEAAERAVMPEVNGHPIEDAREELKAVGLGSKPVYEESTSQPENTVISASLEDGTEVKKGDKILLNTTIILKVSAGANGIDVPDVLGYTEAEATAKLKQEGFNVIKSDNYSDEYAKGTVMSQIPSGGEIAAIESEITIVISKGSSDVSVRVPEVVGMKVDAAKSTIEASDLVVNSVEEVYSSEYPEGQVCYQSYQQGTSVSQGTAIDIKVSKGPEISTYSCNLTINAPADYQGGNAEVVLTNADGVQLWNSPSVSSFPVVINLSGFTSTTPTGVVTISYLKNVEQQVLDADGNASTQTNQALTQSQQTVQFVQN